MSNRINWSKDGTISYAIRIDSSYLRMSQAQQDKFDAEPWTSSSSNEMVGYQHILAFNFPRPVTIDKVAILNSVDKNWYVEVSSDTEETTRPGDLGSWPRVGFSWVGALNYTEFNMDALASTRWLRLRLDRYYMNLYCVHLFGSYDDPNFEMCDQGGAVITDSHWMDWSIAYSDTNWTEDKLFKIRNNDTVPHTYDVTVDQQQLAYDVVFVTDHWKLSNGVDNDVTTLTTALVAPGAFSEDIKVTGTISIIDNPLGGTYYPKVTVNEVQP